MSDLKIGGQFQSISHAGMKIFDQPIESTIGGIVIDLASAPLSPGEHTMHIESGVGGVEIYLPRYVTFTVEGGSTIGGHDVHDGLGLWDRLVRTVHDKLHLSSEIPDHAVENPDPSKPIHVKFVLSSVVGGVDVFRL